MCEDPRTAIARVGDQVSNATGIRTADDFFDAAANFLTLGLVGVEDGKITKGVVTRAADEGIGELTARNQARKANMEAKDAIAAEAAARAKDLADKRARKARIDLQTSVEAGLITSSQTAQQRNQLLGQAEAGMTRDFLGL